MTDGPREVQDHVHREVVMRRRVTWLSWIAAIVVVVGALAFGVRTAVADSADPCQPCFNQLECDDCCIREYGLPGTCFVAQQACLCG